MTRFVVPSRLVGPASVGIWVQAAYLGASVSRPLLGAIEARGRDQAEAARRLVPSGRCGSTEEGTAVLVVCSDKAAFATGQALALDDGHFAR